MSENSSALKSSFFKEYFRYKLRTLRGFTILFAVLNFISVTGFAAGVLIFVHSVLLKFNNEADNSGMYVYGGIYIFTLFLYLMIAVIFIQLLMLAILPAVNFKFYNKRSYMDTIGGLPLTGRQRFLGDILSGAASFGISFVPCFVIAMILAAITQFGGLQKLDGYEAEYILHGIEGDYIGLAITCLLTMLLCYASAYAISCFVTSCCGKVGTSVLFSIIMMGALTIIALSIGGIVVDNAIGFDSNFANLTIISATPPFGTLIATITETQGATIGFAVKTPLVLVILFVIALFGFGSYIAAKRRKTERVEREIVFNAGYYVISAIITVMAGSFSIWLVENKTTYIIPLLLIALATCLVMAYLNSRSFKKIWKGFVVFAAAGAFCLGLGFLIEKTNGLGISTYIPSKQSIKSIKLYGPPIRDKFQAYNEYDGEIIIENENGISLVLSEHQKLVDEIENFAKTRNNYSWPLTIEYDLKNGMTAVRCYTYIKHVESKSDDPTYKFVEAISELPELRSFTVFGLLGNPEMTCTNISYNGSDPNDTANVDHDLNLIVKPSKYDKFVECYLEDLTNLSPNETDTPFGTFIYEYIDKSGITKTFSGVIVESYHKTIEFLKDPDNFEEKLDITVDETKEYYVVYKNGESSIRFNITHTELAHEFLSYAEPRSGSSDDDTECFYIRSSDGYSFGIRKEDEQAALSAFIKAIRAHRAIGGGNNDKN